MQKTLTILIVFALLITNTVANAKTTEAMKEDGDLLLIFIVAILGGVYLLGNILILAVSNHEKRTRRETTFSKTRSRRRLKPVEVNYKMPKPAPNFALRKRANSY